jgi:hypothetical protein
VTEYWSDPMYYLSSGILGGIAALSALGLITPEFGGSPTSSILTSSPAGFARAATRTKVNRTHKGDRLPTRATSETSRAIASVEVVGIDNVAVVYRDRQGNVLFRTDPLSNMTVVAKGLSLPEVTVRDSERVPAQQLPIKRMHEAPLPSSELPIGCESAVSVAADHVLARTPSRCVSELQSEWNFAALTR